MKKNLNRNELSLYSFKTSNDNEILFAIRLDEGIKCGIENNKVDYNNKENLVEFLEARLDTPIYIAANGEHSEKANISDLDISALKELAFKVQQLLEKA
ncbi:hypothetical protein [Dethiothermospora halolimnae]|uniref:hypothetical protein n=1 Tax=Dethiothermospora halolimnae TaxID=3114390 RepID=UPI003CCC0AF7